MFVRFHVGALGGSPRIFSSIRGGFDDCTGPEKVLLYAALVPLLVPLHRTFELAFDGLVAQEFFGILVIFLALAALMIESCRHPASIPIAAAIPGIHGILLPGGLFLSWTVYSVFWAPVTFWALHFAASWFVYLVVLWFLIAAFRHEPFRNLFLGVVLCILSVSSGIGILGYFLNGYRLKSLFGVHPLLSAELQVSLLPLAIGLFLFHPARSWRGAGLASFFLFYWSLLQTAKRAPFIGFLGGMLFAVAVLLFFQLKERGRSRPRVSGVRPSGGGDAPIEPERGQSCPLSDHTRAPWRTGLSALLGLPLWRRLGLVGLLAGILTYAQLTPSLLNGLGREQYNLAKRFQTEEIASVANLKRVQFWMACLEMFKEKPWVGQGAGSFRTLYRPYRARYFQGSMLFGYLGNTEDMTSNRAHNEYLQVLGELGGVGLGLFLVFIVASLVLPLKQIVVTIKKGAAERSAFMALFALAGMISFYISAGASSFGFRNSESAWGFLVVCALALALVAREEERGIEQQISIRTKERGSKTAPFFVAWLLGCSFLLLLSGLIGWVSLRMVIGDLYYWKFGVTRAQTISDLEQSIAWFPQNPGPHLFLAERRLAHLFLARTALVNSLSNAESGPNTQGMDLRGLLPRALQGLKIDDILAQLEAASRHGLGVSIIPAFKAMTAEAVAQPALAHSFLEEGLADFPDSPFLAAYYWHLSRKLGRDEAVTRKRTQTALRYQESAFHRWQTYFEGSKAVVDERFSEYPQLAGLLEHFHRFYREVREQ